MKAGHVGDAPEPVKQGSAVFDGELPEEQGSDDQGNEQADSGQRPVVAGLDVIASGLRHRVTFMDFANAKEEAP